MSFQAESTLKMHLLMLSFTPSFSICFNTNLVYGHDLQQIFLQSKYLPLEQ